MIWGYVTKKNPYLIVSVKIFYESCKLPLVANSYDEYNFLSIFNIPYFPCSLLLWNQVASPKLAYINTINIVYRLLK